MNQSKGKPKFSRLRLSQKPINAKMGVRNHQLSANHTHISQFFQNPSEDLTMTSSVNEDMVSKASPDTPTKNRKRKSGSSVENIPCDTTTNTDQRTKTPKKSKIDAVEEERATTPTTPTTSTARRSTRSNTRQQVKSDTIVNFFASEKDDSFQDFQETEKPIPKSKIIKPKVAAKQKAPSRKKQPDIRKCLQKNSEDTLNKMMFDHCALDEMDPDQLQIALAISRSLADDQETVASDTKSSRVSDSVKEIIQKYSFKSATANGSGDFAPFFGLQPKRGRAKKWQSRCTALTRRNEQIQTEKVTKKVNEILMESTIPKRKEVAVVDGSSYEITSDILYKYLLPEKMLFKINSSESMSSDNLNMYYTNNLMSPAKCKSGVLLRDWASIPGRDSLFDCVPSSVRQQRECLQSEYDAVEIDELPIIEACSPLSEASDAIIQEIDNNDVPNAIPFDVNNDQSHQDVSVDVEKTVLLDQDDIQDQLDVINSQIRLSQLLNTSEEKIQTTADTSDDKTRRFSRESSPDMFADCDIDDGDINQSYDSNATNERSNAVKDNNSEDIDKVLPETPSSEAIEIISISSGVSNFDTLSNSLNYNSCAAAPIKLSQLSSPKNTQISSDSVEFLTAMEAINEHQSQPGVCAESIETSISGGYIANIEACDSIELSDDEMPADRTIWNSVGDLETSPKSNGTQITMENASKLSPAKTKNDLKFMENAEKEVTQSNSEDIFFTQNANNLSQSSIVISDDEINYSMNQSRTDRRNMYHREQSASPMGNDKAFASQYLEPSQESIEISDDEINYSVNKSVALQQNDTIDMAIEGVEANQPNVVDLTQEIVDAEKTILLSNSWTKRISTTSRRSSIVAEEPGAAPSLDSPTGHSMLISDSILNEFEKSSMLGTAHGDRSLNGMNSIRSTSPIILSDSEEINTECGDDLLSRSIAADEACAGLDAEDDNIATEDMVNQSVSKIFERSFNYTKHTPVRTPTANGSSFRKTQSEVWDYHHVELDDVWEFDQIATSSCHKAIDPSSPIKTHQFQEESDEFDRLVYGTPKSATKVIQTPKAKPLTPIESQHKRSAINEHNLDLSNDNYIVKFGNIPPRPDYNAMSMDELQDEMEKFGLKTSLKRRQAIICLEHIYNRTHPYIEYTMKKSSQNILRSGRSASIECGRSPAMQFHNCETVGDVPVSSDDQKLNYNIGFAADNLVGPVFYNAGDMKHFLPSNPRAKKPWCLQPLHIAWYNLLRANPAVHQYVLLYKPVNLNELKAFFKSIEMNYENKDLIAFLDMHCITFQTNKTSKN